MGFTGDFICLLRIMSLYVIFGEEPCSKIVMTKFIVVDIPSAYNAIIGWPTLNPLKAVVFTYYMVMKFSTRTDIGEPRSNQRDSR